MEEVQIRFTDIDINFEVRQSLLESIFVLMTFISDVKIDVNICEPHCVNLIFCEPPP